ncbi:ABC transporter permease [Gaetbulibacter aestuarii]|uniref:FtsX-like permease family protein n=1 Tax=Gaetbulibacter aestuarii TaxID=1502358 RepID=A0ABW7MZY1_9FLAO
MNVSLAWRNIWRNRTRSLIIILSVTIGLFAGIFVLALYQGIMISRVRIVIDSEVGHIQIHNPKFKDDFDPKYTLQGATVKDSLKNLDKIKFVADRSITLGMLSTTTGSANVKINGILPEAENKASQLKDKIISGNELSMNGKQGILVGKKLADKMKLKLGSKLVLTFADTNNELTAGAFGVLGIYQSDNAPLDELNVYVLKPVLNTYLGIDQGSHEVVVLLNRDDDLDIVRNRIATLFPKLLVETWKETSPETNLMVGYVDQFAIIYVVIIMFALAFGIINTMLMSVLERTREIGMLTALGMNRKRVFVLILTETILLTFVGVPFGILLSWFTSNYFGHVGIDISSFSEAAMSGFGFSSMIYPEFPVDSLPVVMIIVFLTALISALFPSIKAIKLQPADALRH